MTSFSSPQSPNAAYPSLNNAAVKDLLVMMKSTLGTLTQTCENLTVQSAKIGEIGPNVNSSEQITSLRKQIRVQDKRQEQRLTEVKTIVKGALKDQIAREMMSQIVDKIREEISLQVKYQVDENIKSHIPILLEEQINESKHQLATVERALQNTEARRANGALRTNSLDETLAIVLKADGTTSTQYPDSIRDLLEYDSERMAALMKDFDLVQSGNGEQDLNRFLVHIGITFNLVSLPV